MDLETPYITRLFQSQRLHEQVLIATAREPLASALPSAVLSLPPAVPHGLDTQGAFSRVVETLKPLPAAEAASAACTINLL